MKKRNWLKVMGVLATVALLMCCAACASSDSDPLTSPTTSTQNKAMENIPGKNTGDGQDKT
ncbi:MAG: hypothetical protein IKV35_06125, partial [Clostridia bacterium]|nr:hypothetical protein [Clostridia bacterium]